MKKNIYQLVTLLLMIPLFWGCDKSDDLPAIFTGKTWKLTLIAVDGGHEMFNFWGNDVNGRKKSLEELEKTNTYTIVFEGITDGDIMRGNIKGTVIAGTNDFSGNWEANAKNNKFSATINASSSGDPLANAFLEGLRKATSYNGDSNNLYILYKPVGGGPTLRMFFRPQ